MPDRPPRNIEADARLADIVENSGHAIVREDLAGVITSWNRGAERIFGYAAAEAVGHPIGMLVPSDKANDMPRILEKVRRGGAVEHYETTRIRKDGERIIVSITVSPIRDK